MSGVVNRKGLLIVVSAPSGAGKTSLCQELGRLLPRLKHSVSYTTRSPRNGEVHGKDYFFVDTPTFGKMVEAEEFAEWARVHNNLYGTAIKSLEEMREQGIDAILDIDTQGAVQLRKAFDDGVFIFILPPSFEVLETRLRNRRSDAEDEIRRRMAKAKEEVSAYEMYDYIVINEDFSTALDELKAIVSAAKCRVRSMDSRWIKKQFLGG